MRTFAQTWSATYGQYMLLILLIVCSTIAFATMGAAGIWVPVIGLALMGVHEAKRPGTDFAESAAALLFIGVVVIGGAALVMRLAQQAGLF